MPGNEKAAKFLGYAGLLPFITFSFASWLPDIASLDVIEILIAYAAVILSFMGAIHWGIAMSNVNQHQSEHLFASVIPALIAWPALLLPQITALLILLISYVVLFAYDWASQTSQAFPDWYIPMRKKLTIIVTLCLTAALLSIES